MDWSWIFILFTKKTLILPIYQQCRPDTNSLIDNVIIYATLLALQNIFLKITTVISVQSSLDLNTDFPVQISSFGLLEWNFKALSC